MAKVLKIFKRREKQEALSYVKKEFMERVQQGQAPKEAMKEARVLAEEKFGIDFKALWAIIGPILMELLKAWLAKPK